MTNGNAKGKRGELELSAVLRAAGYEARRAQQFKGAAGDEDVTHNLPGLHIECKRVEKLNVRQAYKQAVSDALDFKTPIVAHKVNRGPWLVTLSLDDFLSLLKAGDDLD